MYENLKGKLRNEFGEIWLWQWLLNLWWDIKQLSGWIKRKWRLLNSEKQLVELNDAVADVKEAAHYALNEAEEYAFNGYSVTELKEHVTERLDHIENSLNELLE